jgi:hypothetical protein
MSKLSKDWLTENHIDLEFKQYMLLAYLQEVKENYNSNKIYPYLSELIDHYKNLSIIKKNQNEFLENLSKEIKGFDFKNGKLIYHVDEKNELLTVINQIIDFALPLFAENIQEGKTIYEWVEEHLSVKPVGLSPLRNDAGYFFLQYTKEKDVFAYRYEISSISFQGEKHKALYVNEIEHYECSLTKSYENLKIDLISKNKDLPNPAVYAIICDVKVPMYETFLPLAKRYFITHCF